MFVLVVFSSGAIVLVIVVVLVLDCFGAFNQPQALELSPKLNLWSFITLGKDPFENENEDDDEYDCRGRNTVGGQFEMIPSSCPPSSPNHRTDVRGCAVEFLVTGKELGIDRMILFVRLDNR